MEPFHVRAFVPYLLIISVISIVRLLRLGCILFSFERRRSISLQSICDGSINDDQFARAGLRGTLEYGTRTGEHGEPGDSRSRTSEQSALLTLKNADITFLYLWQKSHAMVKSTERLAVLTFFGAFLFLAWALGAILLGGYRNYGGTPNESIGSTLLRFAIGVAVCVALYVLSSLFEGVMQRRRIRWQYLCARLKNDVSG